VMLCWGITDEREATAVADRLLRSLAEPIELPTGVGPDSVTVGASIGVALSPGTGPHPHAATIVELAPELVSDVDLDDVRPPADVDGGDELAESLDDALARADSALYDAKRSGRNRWSLAAP